MPKELSKERVTMYVVHDNRTNIIAEEEDGRDRISNLPDDIIHRILSFIDMKYAVQASTLDVPMLLSAFQKPRRAKFLILNSEFIEALGSDMNQLSREPCPFNNLKCVKIGTAPLSRKDHISKIANPVKNYLLENSPNATFIMDLPQKRPSELLYNVKSKVAKMEEKIQR
nr:F-box domain, cyclin-like protein [Tanacetum cinerariifolium]